ncbi:MAG: SDR family oxidoreductase [Verrucomicrobiales bacterium]|jgi:3-oxoacyl-[acyl-carrier protein] reductase|nr:SDR family oxidoreductase [Verrucomicrobiales bacterium]MDR1305634.1 SDR family oxidoreductase [Verrucomicrobiales bacterium]
MKPPVALVTGSAGGLGAALARRLAQHGWAVAAHYRHSGRAAAALVQSLTAGGATAAAFQADLAVEAEAQRMVGEVIARFRQLDLLINNSGVYHAKPLATLSADEWFEGLNSTATAVFFTTRAALPHLGKAANGRVINLGDAGCERVGARDLAISYHLGKTGALMLTKSFAREAAGRGVTVNMISPGYLDNSRELPDPGAIPAGRFGTADDVWNAVEFLIKPASGYLTGANLIVSGGWNLR